MLAGQALFADDTPVKLLAPGTGRTATGRVWTHVRDERPWNGAAPPAAWYRFSADRKAVHPKGHLEGFAGWMHTDGYAGFGALARAGPVREVACLVLERIPDYKINRVDELLPWNCPSAEDRQADA